MKFGFFGVNSGVLADPETMARVAQTAEDAGWESIWTGEHVVVADPQRPPSPVAPGTHFVDQIASLSFLAAHTSTIRLGTGIVILPQRNPVVLAKELASIDVLSQGRLLVGVGVGYIAGEFEALGIPYGERGGRVDDHIEAMRAIWTQEKPVFKGKFTSFAGVQSKPSPVQTPHPPIIIGGMSAPAYRRAVRHGSGWYGFNQDLEAAAASIAGIRSAETENERPAHLGQLSISVTPRGTVDKDSIKRYEDLGVERLMLLPKGRGGPTERAVQFVEETAARLGLG